MDNLKLFAKDDHELEGFLQTVKKFSSNSSLDQKNATLKKRLEKSTLIELDNSTEIKKKIEQKEVYKYLGVDNKEYSIKTELN